MKLLVVNGSPRVGSSTEILTERVAEGFKSAVAEAEISSVRLNELDIIPCQSCGESPAPWPCFYKDGLYPWLEEVYAADAILIASPIYFDSVSSLTKLFIDRTNCLRPPVFEGERMSFDTSNLPGGKGAYVLVGGEREKFDAAERVIGGMFVWSGIEKIGKLIYSHGYASPGAVVKDKDVLQRAFELGTQLAAAGQGIR
jgi:multimeric flavodoxin WrbA